MVGGLLSPSRWLSLDHRSAPRPRHDWSSPISRINVNTRLGALACAMEASERKVISVIKDNIKETRTSGVLQSESIEKLQVSLRDFSNEVV